MSNQLNRINALERVFVDTSSGPEAYAQQLADYSDSGVTADEIIAEAHRVHNAIGAPFTTKRFVEFVATETGISVTDLLAGSERLRVEIEQAYPPA